MQAATHAGRPVLARYANRGLARHLRKVFGRVPVVRPEGLEYVGIGKEGGPGLAVRAPQLRQVLKDEPEADAVPARQSDVTLHRVHPPPMREFIEQEQD